MLGLLGARTGKVAKSKTVVVSEMPQPYENPKLYRRPLSEVPEEDTTLHGGLPV